MEKLESTEERIFLNQEQLEAIENGLVIDQQTFPNVILQMLAFGLPSPCF